MCISIFSWELEPLWCMGNASVPAQALSQSLSCYLSLMGRGRKYSYKNTYIPTRTHTDTHIHTFICLHLHMYICMYVRALQHTLTHSLSHTMRVRKRHVDDDAAVLTAKNGNKNNNTTTTTTTAVPQDKNQPDRLCVCVWESERASVLKQVTLAAVLRNNR